MPGRAKATLIALGILEDPAPPPPPEPLSGRRHLAVFALTAPAAVAAFALLWLVLHLAGVGLDPALAVIPVGVVGGLTWSDWRRGAARRARSPAASRRRTP